MLIFIPMVINFFNFLLDNYINKNDDLQNIRIINNRYDVIQENNKDNDTKKEKLGNKSTPNIKKESYKKTKGEKEKLMERLNKLGNSSLMKESTQKKFEGKFIYFY